MSLSEQFVLCFGKDAMLLRTRRQLLEQAGYLAFPTQDVQTVAEWLLRDAVSLLVLCHTLNKEEVEVVSRFHREMHSNAPILCLRTGLWTFEPESVGWWGVGSGPAAFLAAVTKLSSEERMPA